MFRYCLSSMDIYPSNLLRWKIVKGLFSSPKAILNPSFMICWENISCTHENSDSGSWPAYVSRCLYCPPMFWFRGDVAEMWLNISPLIGEFTGTSLMQTKPGEVRSQIYKNLQGKFILKPLILLGYWPSTTTPLLPEHNSKGGNIVI